MPSTVNEIFFMVNDDSTIKSGRFLRDVIAKRESSDTLISDSLPFSCQEIYWLRINFSSNDS